jgi:hypothetical protein
VTRANQAYVGIPDEGSGIKVTASDPGAKDTGLKP